MADPRGQARTERELDDASALTGDRRNAFVRWLEGVYSGERWGGHG